MGIEITWKKINWCQGCTDLVAFVLALKCINIRFLVAGIRTAKNLHILFLGGCMLLLLANISPNFIIPFRIYYNGWQASPGCC